MITKLVLNRTIKKVFDDISFMTPFEIKGLRSKAISFNVRIPFCRAQCPFCLFRSHPWNQKLGESYLKAVKKEFELYSELLNGTKVEFVYFSGGTPTIMPEGIAEIVKHIKNLFNYDGDISIEANPNDLDDKTLKVLVDAGVNKISIGVQSFNDGILKAIGRGHDSWTAIDAIKKAKEFDFDYINIDLMFSLPEQKIEDIEQDLEMAVKLGVQGISTYPLILVPYSGAYEQIRLGMVKPTTEKMEQEMYRTIINNLTDSGYNIRALWSFATRPEVYCGPFEFEDYIGIGPSAWSIIDEFFYLNKASLREYIRLLNDNKLPIEKGNIFTPKKTMKLWFMRKLYNIRLDKAQFHSRFKSSIDDELGWITLLLRLFGIIEFKDGYIELTRKGLFYASVATKEISRRLLTKFYELPVKQ